MLRSNFHSNSSFISHSTISFNYKSHNYKKQYFNYSQRHISYSNFEETLSDSWKNILSSEFEKPYFNELKQFLKTQEQQYTIYPPASQVFNAFNHCPYENVKVVLIGQDPYHSPSQANGLSFSVKRSCKIPASLNNIYHELRDDLSLPSLPQHGDLSSWADQGVLLLNSVLTVRQGRANSHNSHGWEQFTAQVLRRINSGHRGIVFLLWGRFAQQLASSVEIDPHRHHLLKSSHPSPFAARKGFFGSRPFSKTNRKLIEEGKEPIDWESILT